MYVQVSFSYYSHFHSRFQFVPQMIFLNNLFGYFSLLIIVKWCTRSQADLYHVMIYMHPFQGQRSLFNQGQTTMMAMATVMRSLSSVKFLYISLYPQSNLFLGLFQIQLLIFVCVCKLQPWINTGMSNFSLCQKLRNSL